MPKTDVARATDGTEIEFQWVYDGAEQASWGLNNAHLPEPLTPLELWLYRNGERGIDRAFAESETEPMATFYRFQHAGPFQYTRQVPWGDERDRKVGGSIRALLERYGSAYSFWQEFCEPRIRATVEYLRDPGNGDPLPTIAERWAHGWWQTFTSAVPIFVMQPRLAALLGEYFDEEEAALLVDEVRQGGENASQAIDGEIDALAAIARRDGVSLGAIQSADGEETLQVLRGDPAAGAFVEAFEALVARHADRSFRWDIGGKTWGEDQGVVLRMIGARVKTWGDHAASRAASLARRDTARERVFDMLPAERHDEFQRFLDIFEGYVGLREDRAYWQMTLTGATRMHLLRRGAELVGSGQLAVPDDILYTLPDEFDGSIVDDLAARAATRRAEWERWRHVKPPPKIGVIAEGDAGETDPEPGAELAGVAASRGRVTGRARVVHDEHDSTNLQEGEILICTTTTPAWTPVFAFAAGVVAETGSPMSHSAIVSREYGIPCVVGVTDAMAKIPDGAMITVDGTTGIVRIES